MNPIPRWLLGLTIGAAIVFVLLLIIFIAGSNGVEERRIVLFWALGLGIVAAFGTVTTISASTQNGTLTQWEILPTILAALTPAIVLLLCATLSGWLDNPTIFKTALTVMQWLVAFLLGIGGLVLLGFRYIEALRNVAGNAPIPSSRAVWTMLILLLFYLLILVMSDPFQEPPGPTGGGNKPFVRTQPRVQPQPNPSPVVRQPRVTAPPVVTPAPPKATPPGIIEEVEETGVDRQTTQNPSQGGLWKPQ